jgi:hypothetical protein
MGEALFRLKTSCDARPLLKPVAMVGWSGAGKFDDLERTVVQKLALGRGDADRIGESLLVNAVDPVAMARSLSLLPGVAWIAVGYRFNRIDSYLGNLELLAKRYLSGGRTFRISAQVSDSKQTAGDAVLEGNSALLSSIPGARVDERRPQVKFRVCIERGRGACGAEIRAGPGGVPTNGEWVACMVSGGERSSSMAWMAALAGFSVRLVHSRTDEVALRRVARLYSELSHRMDPRCLELVLLEGGKNPFRRIGGWVHDHKGAALAGWRPERPDFATVLAERFPNLALPLILVQDEAIHSIFRSLGLGPPSKGGVGAGLSLTALGGRSAYSELKFGGVQADLNTVIDAMERRG